MARGHEDWFINKQAFGKALTDVGELGARFGIPYCFTRGGKVIYTDGFESSLSPWEIITGDDYGDAVIVTDASFRGNNSLKLTPKATGKNYAGVRKVIPNVMGNRVGVEALVAGDTGAECVAITLGVRRDDYFTYYALYFYFSLVELKYQNDGAARISILDLYGDGSLGDNDYYLLKLVVDVQNHAYSYAIMNNHVIPLVDILGFMAHDPGVDKIDVTIRAEDSTNAQIPVWVDDVTITINEP